MQKRILRFITVCSSVLRVIAKIVGVVQRSLVVVLRGYVAEQVVGNADDATAAQYYDCATGVLGVHVGKIVPRDLRSDDVGQENAILERPIRGRPGKRAFRNQHGRDIVDGQHGAVRYLGTVMPEGNI